MSMFILTFKRFNHENVHTYVGQIKKKPISLVGRVLHIMYYRVVEF